MREQKNVAEFFAGIGLVRIGLEKAGWKVSFANDIDDKKGKAYHHHFEQSDDFNLGDIHELNADNIPNIELATASFPCTDLSLAGRREGLAGQQSSAFWGFVKLMKGMKSRRPNYILLENVEGFLTSHKGSDFEQALLALNAIGYSVDAFVIDARHFVPQSRRRLFIVGVKGGRSKNSKVAISALRPAKLVKFIHDHPEIRWNIRSLPELPELQNSLDDMVDRLPANSKEWWDEKRTDYFLNQTSERHRQVIEELRHKKEYHYLTAFRRVRRGRSMAEIRSDGIAGCLRTPKGGSARQILVEVGKGNVKVRYMTPLEYAKLMGAEDYQLTGSKTDQLFGFGDAVCVPVITWIGKNYLNPLYEKQHSLQTAAAVHAH